MLRGTPAVSTVWLDVSLLLAINTNQPTGIPRTIISIFRAWWQAGYTNLRLCRLDPGLDGYLEVDPKDVLARFGESSSETEIVTAPLDAQVSPTPSALWYSPLKQTLRRVAKKLPTPIKKPLRRLVHYVRHGRTIHQQTVEQSAMPSASAAVIAPAMLNLGPSDLVVTLGGGWTQKGSALVCERLKKRCGFRSVHLIYDMIPLKHPQYFPDYMYPDFDGWMVPTLRYVDLAVAISEHTKRDLAEFCRERGLRTPPTEVIRLGEGISPVPAPDYPPITESFNPREPFVLCVGTLEVRKNHYLLYQVWRRLIEERGTIVPKLVLIGSKGWLADDVLHLIRTDRLTREKIVVIPHCDDAQLRWLYQQCLFTVYPSHYEGWGLPIAESLAFGKHCVCSNTSSMPEIAPDLVEAHDPRDFWKCYELIEKALDPAHRTARETQIRQHFVHTPWNQSGRQLADILDRQFGRALQLPEQVAQPLAKSA